jgi:hypothetical protein
MSEEIKQPWPGVRYWILSKDRKCPKCGGVTQLLIHEDDTEKVIIKERCNVQFCWWQIISPEESHNILKEEKNEKPIKTI